MDSWFREIHVLRAWRVYLATGFDFGEKNRAFFGSIGARVCCQSPTLPLYYEGKVMKTTFPKNYVYVYLWMYFDFKRRASRISSLQQIFFAVVGRIKVQAK